ncbi:MAG: type II toxin-antitoxin system HicA family toxin [Syntrophobacteraceae bacterium]
MKGREIIKKLEAKGWRVNRIKGSHNHMTHSAQFTTIPVYGSKDLDIGLIRAIERQTGVKLQ